MVVPKLQHPCTCLVSGPTGCGKTQFVANLLKNNMFEPMPERIIWCYGEDQPLYHEMQKLMPNIEFKKDTPTDLYDSLNPSETNLVILDDQMSKVGNSKDLSRLFTEGSHHRNLSVIYIVQNLFDQGASHRTVSRNSHYIVLFKNPRDMSQISCFGRQMYPKNKANFLPEAYAHATRKPYRYMIIDLKPDTPEEFRIRTKIFPNEVCHCYIAANH